MRALRIAMAALAVAAMVAAPDAAAKKGHKKGHKKGPRVVRVDRIERRAIERDLAAIVAARPRLPDGSRIVLNTRPLPTPRGIASVPVRRRALAPRPFAASTAALTAQRRASAVDTYLRTHQPRL